MIRPALAEMERAAYGCYVLEYAGQDQTGGLLVLDWVISAAGEVQSADIVETSFDSEAFAGCVLEAARGLKFPAAQRPSGVRKPYHFRRAEAETPKAAQL